MKLILGLIGVALVIVQIAIPVAVIWVAYHFISKFW